MNTYPTLSHQEKQNLNPLKEKYWHLYMDIAKAAAQSSYCSKLQVGACVVTPEGMLSIGWNGSPPGFPNVCEFREESKLTTHPWVIHAEANAIYKMLRTGHSSKGSMIFTTHAPCLPCASLLHNTGISRVVYLHAFSHEEGVTYLQNVGIQVNQVHYSTQLEVV